MESLLPKRNPLVRKRVWIGLAIFCTVATAWRYSHKSENYFADLAPGIYLTPGELGNYELLIDGSFYPDIPESKGGSIAVSGVKSLAVQPKQYICGSFVPGGSGGVNWFLIDLRVPQKEIAAQFFNTNAGLAAALSRDFQSSVPSLKNSEEW